MATSILLESNLNCGVLHDISQMYALIACCFIVIVKLATLRINNENIFGIALHVAGQLDWLGEQFQTLNIESTEQECTKTLGALVRRHNQLIQFANVLEDSFNLCIILALAVNMVQICLSGLQMIIDLRNGDIASVINGAIIFYVFNLQIFLSSYADDRFRSGIVNLHTAIYYSTWYNLPQRTIKDLVFITLRTHKTFNLTGGKIYAMNINSFKNILKATLSYFSVMQAILEEYMYIKPYNNKQCGT